MDKTAVKFFLILAVNSWQRIAEGSYSLQPRLAQGRKHVLDDRRVFVDEHRFEGLQRNRGQAPTEFGHCSVGFLFPACLAVENCQFYVDTPLIWA